MFILKSQILVKCILVRIFKGAVKFYAIKHGRYIKYLRNNLQRVDGRCMTKNYNWMFIATRDKVKNTFQIRTCNIENEHKCQINYDIKHILSEYIAQEYLHLFADEPSVRSIRFIGLFREKFHSTIITNQVKRIK